MKKIKFLDLAKQYTFIKEEIDNAISEIIKTSAFIGGNTVRDFEDKFARFQDTSFCVGVGNGTDALEIAIEALNMPAGSEIIVPGNTFIASAEAITRTGHNVIFCDVDPRTYNICFKDLKSRISHRTKAIMLVHLYGHPCEMNQILEIGKEFELKIIEDCAQAHAAEYEGRKVGSFGDISAFSFYPGKNLGAYGDGGAILTNNEDLALKSRMIANHGRVDKYNHEFEGRNSRLDGLQAAILNIKLNHLQKWTERRRAIASIYKKNLENVKEITIPVEKPNSKHVYHLYVIRTKERDDLLAYLNEEGISTGIHYPIALPKLAAYKHIGQKDEDLRCNSMDAELLSLPMGDHLEDDEVFFITEKINNYFR
tara:strand:+ start:88 stop:1191 length:1104 start_codon:yes stop_codon:yes gene_type:complete